MNFVNNNEGHFYDSDYFERGIATGKSCYENYRWMPELTISMAMALIDYLDIEPFHKVLDYGCAKGYLVKALRLLRRQAWGVDVSTYALNEADSDVRGYCALSKPDFSAAYPIASYSFPSFFDYCIAKDVFEHIEEKVLRNILNKMPSRLMFVVVPLGDGSTYNVSAYNFDKSHVHMQPIEWWERLFEDCGWMVIRSSYRVPGLKDNWAHYEEGNGFFTLLKEGYEL